MLLFNNENYYSIPGTPVPLWFDAVGGGNGWVTQGSAGETGGAQAHRAVDGLILFLGRRSRPTISSGTHRARRRQKLFELKYSILELDNFVDINGSGDNSFTDLEAVVQSHLSVVVRDFKRYIRSEARQENKKQQVPSPRTVPSRESG